MSADTLTRDLACLIRYERARHPEARHRLAVLTEAWLRLRGLKEATVSTYLLIEAEPGINPSEIARKRRIRPESAHRTVYHLERLGLIRTELLPGPPTVRACFVKEN